MANSSQGFITLQAAYGRFYPTKQEALDAWNDGKDFKIANGPYCSIRDAEYIQKKLGSAYIRYGLDNKSVKVI